MDNNFNNTPEIVPDAPEAVIPEINTIEPINELPAVSGDAVIAEQAPQTAAEPAVPEAFPGGTAPVVYANGNSTMPSYEPYYAAADDYTSRSGTGEGLALTGFILGLSSLVLTWGTPFCYICIAIAVAGIIFAAFAKKKGAANSFQKSGLTMAIIGLVLSLLTSVSCTAIDACTAVFSELASSEIINQLESEGYDMLSGLGEEDFEILQQFVEQYGNPGDVEEFNQVLDQLQSIAPGE